MMTRSKIFLAAFLGAVTTIQTPAFAGAPTYSEWAPAIPEADTDNSVAGGCPIETRDGLTIYMASAREGGFGGLDIWTADRFDTDEPFGEAQNLGEPVNSEYADYCPTPLNGNSLMFVTERPSVDGCGAGDMYIIQRHPALGWGAPVNLGCAETGEGPNTSGGEYSPSVVKAKGQVYLFFSSNGSGNMDIFVSKMDKSGQFGPGQRIDALSTEYDDRMPNVSHDGLEIVFSSNRPVWVDGELQVRGQDVYSSSRASLDAPWSAPVNLGTGINTAADETRSSMSWDRERLHFGRSGEIFVSQRSKIKDKNK